MVNGRASGIGIRESDGLITGNTSRFVPHLFYR
jgi:glutathionylspermidine synthase